MSEITGRDANEQGARCGGSGGVEGVDDGYNLGASAGPCGRLLGGSGWEVARRVVIDGGEVGAEDGRTMEMLVGGVGDVSSVIGVEEG